MDVYQVPPPAPRTPLALRLDEVELLDSILSVGVFGELREAIWLGTPCVARKLPEAEKREDQIKNCLRWNSLNHPNIVMLMGVSVSPGADSWVVTELLTVNLANLLKNSPHSLLPLPFKLSILHDVALAVRYLHSMTPHPLLHGDLQAEHVFLTPSVRAKLDLWDTFFASDLEIRKASTEGILNVDLEVTFHLSPEVLVEGYSAVKQSGKSCSDVFSFGVLCLHVLVQKLPVPKDAMIVVSTDKAIFFSEQERRSRYLKALQSKEKLLLPIITQCLEPQASHRPSMAALCDRLSLLQAQIGVGKQGESILNGGTVVDIGNHLQRISESADKAASDLQAFQSQLRSLLGLADDAIVPAPNTPTLPRTAKKKMFDIGDSSSLGRLKTLPDHFRHLDSVPTLASSEPEIHKVVDSPLKIMEVNRPQAPSPAPRVPLALRLHDVELLDNVLSVGAFGELREAVWMGTHCASRKLPEGEKREDQVHVKNCLLWNSLNHPSIVMLLGVSGSPGADSWVVTELLTVNLASLLKNSPHSLLPLPFKLPILHDVACAVRYLHSLAPHPLLHGDLQAEHVFLTPGLRAKLDLWDTFFASNQNMRRAAAHGFLPDDMEVTFHLSPEVLVEGYSAVKQSGKSCSDVFSFGVLCLHVLVQRLPIPTESMIVVNNEQALLFTEQERRSEYTKTLQDKEMLFLPIITQCLEASASHRPSMAKLCDRLSQLQTQIGVGKQGESVLNGRTVIDIRNHLQHISESVDTTTSQLEAYRIQLRSLLGLADNAIVPVPNTPTLPSMAKKQMFNVTYSSTVAQHKSLPTHCRHGSRVPISAFPQLKTCKEMDSPLEVSSSDCYDYVHHAPDFSPVFPHRPPQRPISPHHFSPTPPNGPTESNPPIQLNPAYVPVCGMKKSSV